YVSFMKFNRQMEHWVKTSILGGGGGAGGGGGEEKVATDSDRLMPLNQTAAQNLARLQSFVDEIFHWCKTWGIVMNTQKTVCKTFSLKREKQIRPIAINNKSIPWSTDSVRWLGVWFDKRLTWGDHVKKRVSQAYKRLQALFPLLNRKSKINMRSSLVIYKTILKPVLTYGAPVWLPTAYCHLKKFEIFQNKVLRIITKAPWFVKNRNIQKDLKIESIEKCCVDQTINILRSSPHGIGRRRRCRRGRPHLPQDLPKIVDILL
ncbi:hypothetical protein WDU94_000575, partial [Cyamophila willieti]